MSVGKNHHYSVTSIVPRHFLQTAELAGVGAPLMRALFESLADSALKQTDAVIASLPREFPDQLVTSVSTAMKKRTQLLVSTAVAGADA